MSEEIGQQDPNAQSGSGSPSGVLGGAGSQNQPTSWVESLNEAYRSDPTITGIKAETMPEALNAMANMTINAQKLVGAEKWPALKEGSTPEEIRAWKQQHLGVPEGRDKYEAITEYTSVAEDGTETKIPISEEISNDVLDVAAELGLNQADANKLAEVYSKKLQAAESAAQEALNQKLANDMAAFRQELGNNFQLTMDAAEAGLAKLASPELMETLGRFPEITNNPEFIKIFADIGLQMQDARSVNSGRNIMPNTPVEALAKIKEIQRTEDYQKILRGEASPAVKENLTSQLDILYKQAYPN